MLSRANPNREGCKRFSAPEDVGRLQGFRPPLTVATDSQSEAFLAALAASRAAIANLERLLDDLDADDTAEGQ